ncbi:MAG: ATP-dependent DNA helicase RecG, partial [Clostridia bacterium]|nr:ATP-dependent DNA helicase RecG [Clostridia bacterium]
MANLNDDIRYTKGIGEARAKALDKVGVHTLHDLIRYFPRTYEDRTKITPIAALEPGQAACIHAMAATEPTLSRVRRGMELVKLRIADDSGFLDVTYFNQSYVRSQFHKGESYVFYGRLSEDGFHRSLINPLFESVNAPATITGRIVPIYRLTSGLSQKVLIGVIRRSLDECAGILPDALPQSVADARELCQPTYAYENIHFPSDFLALELARRRLIFEELFVLSCALQHMKKS